MKFKTIEEAFTTKDEIWTVVKSFDKYNFVGDDETDFDTEEEAKEFAAKTLTNGEFALIGRYVPEYDMFEDDKTYTLDSEGNLILLDLNENVEPLEETYTDDELDDMIGKVYNLQKIENIYRRKKYGEDRLYAHTICTKCGRDKRVFLSNLVNDPEKYGSCICSDENIDTKIKNIKQLYNGTRKLSSNTSGYTGVSFVKSYKGKPYNKWRAYIEVDGVRTYLGDFDSKAKAIKARKEAGEKGIKWYRDNKNKLTRDVRRKTKKYSTSKYRETQKKKSSVTHNKAKSK